MYDALRFKCIVVSRQYMHVSVTEGSAVQVTEGSAVQVTEGSLCAKTEFGLFGRQLTGSTC